MIVSLQLVLRLNINNKSVRPMVYLLMNFFFIELYYNYLTLSGPGRGGQIGPRFVLCALANLILTLEY